jgi:hypothetical protein
VVQESLTNAARHAPGAQVTVAVGRQGSGSRIDVVNEAPAQPGVGAGSGSGLIGLDERVRLAGGRLDAGPRPDGGWAVVAVLPDAAGPRRLDDSAGGFELRGSKSLTRRRMLQTAALPLGVGLALVGALVVVQKLTLTDTGLPAEQFSQLRLGAPRAQIEPLLPSRDVREPPRVLVEPPQPSGASCVYYEAGSGLFDLDADLYQLCFVDDVLVSKDLLERG